MKKLLRISIAFIGLLALTQNSHAQIITSVQFVGGANAPLHGPFFDYTAGALSVGNWNPVLNVANTTSPQSLTVTSGLTTSTGGPSTIQFSLNASGAYYTGAGSGFTTSPPYPGYPTQLSGPGDAFLYEGFAFAGYSDLNPLTLTISNLTPGDNYDILAYVTPFTFFGNNQTATTALAGGPTYFGTTDATAATYEKITSLLSGSPTTGNYVEFDNLTGASSHTITFTNTSTLVGISGFQVVDLGPAALVPEPSEALLMGIGLVSLVVLIQRKRCVKA